MILNCYVGHLNRAFKSFKKYGIFKYQKVRVSGAAFAIIISVSMTNTVEICDFYFNVFYYFQIVLKSFLAAMVTLSISSKISTFEFILLVLFFTISFHFRFLEISL